MSVLSRTLTFLNGGNISKHHLVEMAAFYRSETYHMALAIFFAMTAFLLWDYLVSPEAFLVTFLIRSTACFFVVFLIALSQNRGFNRVSVSPL